MSISESSRIEALGRRFDLDEADQRVIYADGEVRPGLQVRKRRFADQFDALRRGFLDLGNLSDEDFQRIPKLILRRAGYGGICKFRFCGGTECGNNLSEGLLRQNRLRRAAARSRLISMQFLARSLTF